MIVDIVSLLYFPTLPHHRNVLLAIEPEARRNDFISSLFP